MARLTRVLGALVIALALLAPPSAASTTPVKDINPGSGGSDPYDLTSFGGRLYFSADDGSHGYELWASDGTGAGTTLVSDINPGSPDSLPYHLTVADAQGRDVLYFSANDGTHGDELWAYGVAGLIKDINPGSGGSDPSDLTTANDTLYFTADEGTHGTALWTSDGTSSDTTLVSDISSNPANLTDVDGTLYFTAYDATDGTELWTSNGTTARLVEDINPGSGSSLPSGLTNAGGTLYFIADDGTHGPELWKSNGTAATTTLVADIHPGSYGSDLSDLVNVNGTLYFSADDGLGYNLWKSDGTSAGTTSIGDIEPYGGSPLAWLTNVGGTWFFVATDSAHGQELWRSDGTPAGTRLVKDINPGGGSSGPSYLTNVNGALYFTADDGTHGRELWTTDGTAAGTTLVSDINPGSAGSDPCCLTALDGTLYFSAADGTHGAELWSFRPTLTISRNGVGSGTVTSSTDGIDCGSECSHDYAIADTVTLQAIPGSGSTFSGWSGACSGNGPTCTVQMTADRSITATFAATPDTLTVSGTGSGIGTVTSSPSGIACGSSCTQSFVGTVPLQAIPGSDSTSLAGLRISPRRVSTAGRHVKHQCVKPTKNNNGSKHCRLPIKLQISYTLNIPATVTITLEKQAPGRSIRGKCGKPTNKNRTHKKCTRLAKLNGSLSHAGTAGSNSFAWNGRIGARYLPSGTYTLIVTPTANGQTGTPQQTTFKILG
ncbi:MAG: ELWxxDGT repeat protein [Solirubrobacteraceae bacterium]